MNVLNTSIKNKILISYVILLILPLSLIAILNFQFSAEIIQEKAEKQFNEVAKMANHQLDLYFEDIDNLSINILQNPIVQERLNQSYVPNNQWTTKQIEEELKVRAYLNGMYKLKPGLSSIMIYGFNGQLDYYHPIRRWDHSVDSTKEKWFQETIDKEGSWLISGKREERQLFVTLNPNPEEVITFSRLVRDLNTFKPLGVLVINIKLQTISNVAGVNDPSNSLLIFDKQGDPVVTSELYETRKQEDWLKVSSISPYTKWKSVYLVSKESLVKETKGIRNLIIGFTIFLSVAALIAANLLTSGIVKPLEKLKEKMKEVETGEFNQINLPKQSGEISALTSGFNRMVERIKGLLQEIRLQEKKRLETELSALQARINPHFMYNTLNGFRWTAMMEGNHRLAKLIESLVYLLKFSSKNKQSLITVKEELILLTHYLELMKMRSDQFEFVLKTDEEVQESSIIPFLLQPIVENAIFHGITPLKEKGEISVELSIQGDKNIAVIRDNGVGIKPEVLPTLLVDGNQTDEENHFNKIGLKNVYDRLKLRFGSLADLKVTSKLGKGTTVYIEWPVNFYEEDEHV